MEGLLYSPKVDNLVRLLVEAARSTDEGVKRFVPPTQSALSLTTTKQHHIVFGRRGSGKSSLLRKAASDLTLDRRPIAYVDLESFKDSSYPDILLGILIKTFTHFEDWLNTAAISPASKKSFWQKWGATPNRAAFNRDDAESIARLLRSHCDTLRNQLYVGDESTVRRTVTSSVEMSSKDQTAIQLGTQRVGISMAEGGSTSEVLGEELQTNYSQSKIEFVRRRILEYQDMFRQMSRLSGGDAFLFLDDLYHVRQVDQVRVLDYFHRVAKGNQLWLKVGTIRHRTKYYSPGDPPMGMQLGHDAHEIDLDLTLEKFSSTRQFLTAVLEGFLSEAGTIDMNDILVDDALTRLILASGGVARDFLGIFRRSIDIARERQGGFRGQKVGAEDVNAAAGEYDQYKRADLAEDARDDRATLEATLENIRNFCFNVAHANVFLIDKDTDGKAVSNIAELVDLRLLHKVKSRLSSWDREGTFYEAYMLDLSQYTGARKIHDFKIVEFWRRGDDNSRGEDKLRKSSYIYVPDTEYSLSKSSRGRKPEKVPAGDTGFAQGSIEWKS